MEFLCLLKKNLSTAEDLILPIIFNEVNDQSVHQWANIESIIT